MTPEQHEERRTCVGASDLPALFGADGFGKTAGDLWHEKVYGVDRPGQEYTTAQAFGLQAEPWLVNIAAQQYGLQAVERQVRRVHVGGDLAATYDGLAGPVGIESKVSFHERDDWGKPGTADIPLRVRIQVYGQIIVGNLDYVLVPAMVWSRRLEPAIWVVDQPGDFHGWRDVILETCAAFMRKVRNREPVESPASLETLKSLRRNPGEVVKLDGALLAAWDDAKAKLRAAKDAEAIAEADADNAQAAILQAMGAATLGECPDGRIVEVKRISVREHTRPAYAYNRVYVRPVDRVG